MSTSLQGRLAVARNFLNDAQTRAKFSHAVAYMKLIFRLIWLFLTQSRRSRVDVLGPATTPLRVFPNDLDIFLHVNNGVYLTFADLGRTDLMLRSGIFHKIRQFGWHPVAAAATVRFRKSLTLGQRFTITTRIVGWDTKSIYIEQIFKRADVLVAQVLVDARFLSKTGGRISTDDVLELLQVDKQSPPLPAPVERWIASMR